MKNNSNLPIEFKGSRPTAWIVLFAGVLLITVFILRQITYMPVNAYTVKDFVLDESKEKASPVKKYFPKPYSVKDLQRGEYDRH